MRAIALAALVSTRAFAAGFALPEQSARSIGTGGTGTASAEGAAAVFYNPGSLGFEEGFSAEVGGLLIVPQFNYEPLRAVDGKPASADTQLFALPAIFLDVPLGPVHVGLGAFANYGLGISWPLDFDGRFQASKSNLQTFTVNPSVAWRFHEHVSVGAGFDLVRGTVELSRQIDLVDSEGTLRLGGGTWGFGGNAGVTTHWLADRLAVGLAWRSAVALRFHGSADFTVPREFQAQLRDQDVSTTFRLPHTVSLGAAFRATSRLRLSLDGTYTTWSRLQALQLDFADPALATTLRFNWSDTVSVRAGAELQVLPEGKGRALLVRLGAGFDPSPAPSNTLSPSLPDASRIFFSAGLGFRAGNFSADLGYLFVFLIPRESEPQAFPARYSGLAHVIGLSVGFRQ